MDRTARARRHVEIVAAYRTGLPSRAVAGLFDMNDSHIRAVLRLYGVMRPPGRPVITHKNKVESDGE